MYCTPRRWLTSGRASGRKKVAPKHFMMEKLKRGHCTTRSTVLAAPPAMVKDKSGEGSQTAVGLYPINDAVQPDVLQQGRAIMACRRSKSQGVRAATYNMSIMVCLSGEVVDALHRTKIDLCSAKGTRWKGRIGRMLGVIGKRYKLFWQGCNKGNAGVCVFIAERWVDIVVDVVAGIPKQDSIFIGRNLNDHVGRGADGYGGIHGGMGFGIRNAEGERILEISAVVGMAVCNTFFKIEDSYDNYLAVWRQ